MSQYPQILDDNSTIPLATDNVTQISASTVNNLRSAILAIEAELGTDPSSVYSSVKDRLDAMMFELEAITGGVSIALGPVSGDLGGSLPSPTVVDLTIPGEQHGSILYYNGSNWVQLNPGTDGTVLTTHDVGGNPTWGASTSVTSNPPVNITKSSAVVGTAILAARADHKHDITTATAGSIGATNAEGTSTSLARADHTHSVVDLNISGQSQGSILYFNGANWIQLAPGVDGYVLTTHNTGANPSWTSANATNLNFPGQTQGDVTYFDGTKWNRLPAGIDGYVLTTHTNTSNPTWAPSGSNLIENSINGGAAVTLDLSGSNITDWVINLNSANCVITFNPLPAFNQQIKIRFVQDGYGGRSVTLPSMLWRDNIIGMIDGRANAETILWILYNRSNNELQDAHLAPVVSSIATTPSVYLGPVVSTFTDVISSTNIIQPNAAPGLYSAKSYITITSAGSSGKILSNISYTDDSGTLLTVPLTGPIDITNFGNAGSGEIKFSTNGASGIQYGVSSVPGTFTKGSLNYLLKFIITPENNIPSPALTPPSVGLTMWFDARAVAYSDFAGTIPVSAPYGRVARIDQSAPASAGSWLTRDATTGRAWRENNAIDFRYGETTRFAQPSALSVNASNCTWGFSFHQRTSGTPVDTIYFGDDAVSNWGIFSAGAILIYAASTSFSIPVAIPPGAFVYGVIQYFTSTISATVVINGVTNTYSTAAANNNNVTRNLFIGSAIGDVYHTHTAISQVLAYNNTTVDVNQLLAFLSQNVPAGFPINSPLIAIAGDSISQGVTATTALSEFYQAQANLAGNATPPRLLNAGLSNLDLTGLISRYAAEIKPSYNPARAKNILLVQCMTNSMPCTTATAAATAASVLSQYYAYCDQAKADGWIVILFTCLPRADSGSGTGFPTAWAIVNTDIRANYLSHGHDLADVASVSGMSLISDAASGPNFSDQLHPNNTGQALLEPTVLAAIQRRLV